MENEDQKYERAKKRVQKLRAFYNSLITYFLINVLLIIINLLTSPHHLWFYWVTVIWGAVLIMQAFNTFTIRDTLLGDEWEKKKIQDIMDKEKFKNQKP